MSTTNKPTIVFIPGAWHKSSQYSPLTDRLTSAGYTVKTVDYPSTGSNADELPDNFDGDIAAIRAVLVPLIDQGHEIALVAHSAGGLLASEAAKGLAKSNTSSGGGIVKMVYICAFAAPEGVSINSANNGIPSWQKVKGRAVYALDPVARFYNLCPPEVAKAQVAQLGLFAAGTLDGKATYAAWKHILSAYLVCENDNAISVQAQEAMVG